MSILSYFYNLWNFIMSLLGFKINALPPNHIQVFVKTNEGEKVFISLDPSWPVHKIKSNVALKLKSKGGTLKLIFAGKELPDDLTIGQCDLGMNSVLHAVILSNNKVTAQSSESSSEVGSHSKSLQGAIGPGHSLYKIDESTAEGCAGELAVQRKQKRTQLLCDPSTVLTIQLSESDQHQLKSLKAAPYGSERHYFYVYCSSPCASVRVGKLRVRCVECKGGAITVNKDPSSWNDVLLPKQIEAVCETPGCVGSYAEFYFKCRDHETSGEDDIAVVLYLVRVNVPGVLCLACLDVTSPIVVFECDSSHAACLDCFINYTVSRLNERRFILDNTYGYTLPCPASCENSLIKETHHFRLMGEEQYDRYQRFATEEALLAAGGVICPRPGCGQGILPDEYCRRITCVRGCGFVFCRDCLEGFHIGECALEEEETTEELTDPRFPLDPARAEVSRWEKASKVAIKTLTKPCPKCRIPTERDGGCMHMVCVRASCQFGWCWVCQTKWTRECMGAHWFG